MYVLARRERRVNANRDAASGEYLSFESSLQHKSTKADFTYNEAKIGVVTNLEAFLGIIIACLSMFPPALKKVLSGKDNSDSGHVISSSVARLRFKSSKPPVVSQIR